MNKLILVLKTPGYTETILEFSIAQEGMLEAESWIVAHLKFACAKLV